MYWSLFENLTGFKFPFLNNKIKFLVLIGNEVGIVEGVGVFFSKLLY